MISLVSRGVAYAVESSLVGLAYWHVKDAVLAVYGSRNHLGPNDAQPAAVIHCVGASIPQEWCRDDLPRVCVQQFQPISTGDILAIHPSGRVDTLFRADSLDNALFVTEQCNSHCLMCSQPPRSVDDLEHFLTQNVRAVRLMPPSTRILGITGGEPTLLGERLADLLAVCRASLPSAQIDILSNGRLLADRVLAARIGGVADDRMLFTIPLYADNSPRHDYIVQSRGAFVETIAGFYNLAEAGVRCEVRVVLHKASFERLPQIARFVQKNLPFVDQVAFMGLEMTGLARANEERLWIEPSDYMPLLEEAVDYLTDLGIPSSIYNLPRCLTPASLWPYLRFSISDWKREYVDACALCSERENCGGVFGTSSRLSAQIRPL